MLTRKLSDVITVGTFQADSVEIAANASATFTIPYTVPVGYRKAILASLLSTSWAGVTLASITLGNGTVILTLCNSIGLHLTLTPAVNVLFIK